MTKTPSSHVQSYITDDTPLLNKVPLIAVMRTCGSDLKLIYYRSGDFADKCQDIAESVVLGKWDLLFPKQLTSHPGVGALISAFSQALEIVHLPAEVCSA